MRASLSRPCSVLLTGVLLCWLPAAGGGAVESEAEIEVSPQRIGINSFYHGTDLELRGSVPVGSKIALVVMGEKEEHALRRKGRVGPLWMNVETVTVKGAPQMYYIITSSETLEELAPSEVLAKRDIGYEALRKSVTIEQEGSDYDSTFREFVRLKESMGLYKTAYHSIEVNSRDEEISHFAVSLAIPPLVPPGEYEIRMHCFDENQPISNVSSRLTVEKVGLPQKLSTLAFEHAALYGILAIVVAVAAGLFMGVLFGKKKKGGK